MKILTTCTKCGFETVQPETFSLDRFVVMPVEVNSEGFYELECPRGHKSVTWVQNEQFELLFDSAVLALLDGYSREAVSSFAASLERFHEYCIRVIYNNKENNNDEFEKIWKSMSKQSERQLGAFYMAYLSEFKKAPPIIPNRIVEFRNRVIHKGEFPSTKESESYGEFIYKYVIEMLIELKKQCPDGFHKPSFYRMQAYTQKKDLSFSNTSLATSLSILSMKLGSKNFKEVLDRMKTTYSYSK